MGNVRAESMTTIEIDLGDRGRYILTPSADLYTVLTGLCSTMGMPCTLGTREEFESRTANVKPWRAKRETH